MAETALKKRTVPVIRFSGRWDAMTTYSGPGCISSRLVHGRSIVLLLVGLSCLTQRDITTLCLGITKLWHDVKVSLQEPATETGPRGRLLAAALRLLAAGGPETLQARRLAAEVGASTMAVYTHFGGMGQLIREVVRAGYIWFGGRLAEAERSDDPVADLLALGMAYRDSALENPQLYRLMFGTTAPVGLRAGVDPPVAAAADALPEAQAAFAQLVALVTRVMEASGRPYQESPGAAAFQLWSAVHGYVLLEIAGFFRGNGQAVERFLLPLLAKLAAGIGASPEHAAHCASHIAASGPRPQ
jgi:AcrR family transcriptional regulator